MSTTRENGREAARKTEQCLGKLASQWATPNSHDWKGQGANDGSNSGFGSASAHTLSANTENWATPNATDSETAGGPMQKSLSKDVGQFSHQGQATNDGQKSSATRRTSPRRLNPAFVNWLMGSPWWWTRAEPINCAAQEMEWSCFKQALRSQLYSLA
jgi:hypothetical protein